MTWTGKFYELGIPLTSGAHDLTINSVSGTLQLSDYVVEEIKGRGGDECRMTVSGLALGGDYIFEIARLG